MKLKTIMTHALLSTAFLNGITIVNAHNTEVEAKKREVRQPLNMEVVESEYAKMKGELEKRSVSLFTFDVLLKYPGTLEVYIGDNKIPFFDVVSAAPGDFDNLAQFCMEKGGGSYKREANGLFNYSPLHLSIFNKNTKITALLRQQYLDDPNQDSSSLNFTPYNIEAVS